MYLWVEFQVRSALVYLFELSIWEHRNSSTCPWAIYIKHRKEINTILFRMTERLCCSCISSFVQYWWKENFLNLISSSLSNLLFLFVGVSVLFNESIDRVNGNCVFDMVELLMLIFEFEKTHPCSRSIVFFCIRISKLCFVFF